MSEINRTISGREYAHLVRAQDGQYYYVDTARLEDGHRFGEDWYETAVFPYDIANCEVVSWQELYVYRFKGKRNLAQIHNNICYHLEEFLKKGDRV